MSIALLVHLIFWFYILKDTKEKLSLCLGDIFCVVPLLMSLQLFYVQMTFHALFSLKISLSISTDTFMFSIEHAASHAHVNEGYTR